MTRPRHSLVDITAVLRAGPNLSFNTCLSVPFKAEIYLPTCQSTYLYLGHPIRVVRTAFASQFVQCAEPDRIYVNYYELCCENQNFTRKDTKNKMI